VSVVTIILERSKVELMIYRRYDLLVSGLYPNETKFRELCVPANYDSKIWKLTFYRARKEMKRLINKFPDGLQEGDPLYAPKLGDIDDNCPVV
jgi:hypothetical protein